MRGVRSFVFILFVLLATPMSAGAQVVISEIMYDVDGADTGYEWIEVFNAGSGSVPLSDWRLFEADTNHKITSVQGGDSLAPGAYAIIADNSAKFLQRYTYSGQLFDSAFSLSNSGETIGLRNADLVDKDTVNYMPELGAAGDGNSLQRSGVSGTSFSAAPPTMETGSLQQDTSGGTDTTDTSTTDSVNSDNTDPADATKKSTTVFSVEPQIYAYAGEDQTVIAGADVAFTGHAFSKSGEPLDVNAVRFLWNFGDGSIKTGESILHHWSHPGRYILVLDISQQKNAASDSVIITAEPARIAVGLLSDGSITLTNNAGRTLDLSLWWLKMAGRTFQLPSNTRILAGSTVAFSPDVTGLSVLNPPAQLLYPNGEVAVVSGGQSVDLPASQAAVAEQPPQPKSAVSGASRVIGAVIPSQQKAVAAASQLEDELAQKGALEAPEAPNLAASAEVVSMTAGAANAAPGVAWLLGLFGLLGAGGIATFLIRRAQRASWQIAEVKEVD